MKYFLYARKSTEDEERQVMSIEAQLAELAEYAKRENIDIVEQFIESKSAKSPGREVFNKMIAQIHTSSEPIGIIAWHPDRLARNSVDGGQIIYLIDINKISSLRFPTFWFEPTPQGLFMLQVAFGQSKYYSDNLSENVRRGFRQKLRRGEWPTLAPYGYINNPRTRNIEPDPLKYRIIARAFDEFAQGLHTLESLSKRLSFLGLSNRHGRPLSKSAIQRVLTNQVYIGLIVQNGEAFEGKFQPIVSGATFEAVQAILKNRAKPRKSKQMHDFPFTGLLTCGECGCAITAQYAHGNGGTYRYYRCTKKLGKCSQKYLREDLLAQQFKDQLLKVALCDDWASKMLSQIDIWKKEKAQTTDSFAQNIDHEIKVVETKLEKLVTSYLDELIDKDIYLKKKEELLREKVSLIKKKTDFGQKGNNWIEPLRDWVKTANSVGGLALANDMHKIKSFAEKIGTNRRLRARSALVDFKRPYDLILKFKSFRAQDKSLTLGSSKKFEKRQIWSG